MLIIYMIHGKKSRAERKIVWGLKKIFDLTNIEISGKYNSNRKKNLVIIHREFPGSRK
jgi:hypothetical protein